MEVVFFYSEIYLNLIFIKSEGEKFFQSFLWKHFLVYRITPWTRETITAAQSDFNH